MYLLPARKCSTPNLSNINLKTGDLRTLDALLLSLPSGNTAPLRSLAQTTAFVYGTTYFNETGRHAIGSGLHQWRLPEKKSGADAIPVYTQIVAGAVSAVAARKDDLFYSIEDVVYMRNDHAERESRIGNLGQGKRITSLLVTGVLLGTGNTEGFFTLWDNEHHLLIDNKQLASNSPLTALERVEYNGDVYVIAGSEDAYLIVLRLSDQHVVARRKLRNLAEEKPVSSIKALAGDDPELIFSCGSDVLGCRISELVQHPRSNQREGLRNYAGVSSTDRTAYGLAVIPNLSVLPPTAERTGERI